MESSQDWKILLKAFWKNRIYPFVCPPKHPNIGLLLLCTFGMSFLTQLIWQGIPENKLFFSKTSLIGYAVITLFRLLFLLLIYVFVTEHFEIQEHYVWGRNPGLGAFFMSFLVGVPAMLLSIGVHNLFIFFELKLENPIPSQLYYCVSSDSSEYGFLLNLVIGVLFPILIEELFFRGLVYAVLPKFWWVRIFVPALLSTFFATNRLEFFTLLSIALCTSVVRFFTDNVLCSCFTRIGLVCSTVLLRGLLAPQDPELVQNAIDYSRTVLYSSIIGVAIGIVMLMVLFRQLRDYRRQLLNEDARCDSEEAHTLEIPMRAQFRLGFFLGLLFLLLCWIFA